MNKDKKEKCKCRCHKSWSFVKPDACPDCHLWHYPQTLNVEVHTPAPKEECEECKQIVRMPHNGERGSDIHCHSKAKEYSCEVCGLKDRNVKQLFSAGNRKVYLHESCSNPPLPKDIEEELDREGFIPEFRPEVKIMLLTNIKQFLADKLAERDILNKPMLISTAQAEKINTERTRIIELLEGWLNKNLRQTGAYDKAGNALDWIDKDDFLQAIKKIKDV